MISIIIPTLNRKEKLYNCLNSLLVTIDKVMIEAIVIVEDNNDYEICRSFNDQSEKLVIRPIFCTPLSTPVLKWNLGLLSSTFEWVMLGADDLIFLNDWIRPEYLMVNQFLGFRDREDLSNRDFCPHFVATKAWLRKYNGGVLAIPHYEHYFFDIEVSKKAWKSQTYTVAPIELIHKHPIYGTSEKDSTYERGMDKYTTDLKVYLERERNDFPNDFDSIL